MASISISKWRSQRGDEIGERVVTETAEEEEGGAREEMAEVDEQFGVCGRFDDDDSLVSEVSQLFDVLCRDLCR
ncbi:hypothetical protein EYF80_009778 [Liparis tanakae]|uniref:Uncharacterized protein n=1 Tax=Liparis tanakae TaxID=230148 RepID=A0A4Z2IQ47_9TELE|nr:hypothetical protein EYF80_009778 [Liparis tanakae]